MPNYLPGIEVFCVVVVVVAVVVGIVGVVEIVVDVVEVVVDVVKWLKIPHKSPILLNLLKNK
jgi:hypothetical protein